MCASPRRWCSASASPRMGAAGRPRGCRSAGRTQLGGSAHRTPCGATRGTTASWRACSRMSIAVQVAPRPPGVVPRPGAGHRASRCPRLLRLSFPSSCSSCSCRSRSTASARASWRSNGCSARPASAARRSRLSVLFIALGIVGNLPGGILYALGHGRSAPGHMKAAGDAARGHASWRWPGSSAADRPAAVRGDLPAAPSLPGLPLGLALFGRRHAAGWVAGAPDRVRPHAADASGRSSPPGVASACRVRRGLVGPVPRALGSCRVCAVRRLTRGHRDAGVDGSGHSRVAAGAAARAGADGTAVQESRPRRRGRQPLLPRVLHRRFLWHSALASELGKFSLPPRNPYLAPRTMNYYWTYFLLPSTVARLAPGGAGCDVQRCLKSQRASSPRC